VKYIEALGFDHIASTDESVENQRHASGFSLRKAGRGSQNLKKKKTMVYNMSLIGGSAKDLVRMHLL
jgi:hypothetical protein